MAPGRVCWRLFLQAASRIENNDIPAIWELPVWPVAFVMAFASVLMVSSLLLHLVAAVRTAATGETANSGGGTPQAGG